MDAATALSSRLGVPAGFVPPPLPLAKKLPEGADALAHAARGLTRRLPQHARRLHRDALQVAAACAAVSSLDEAALTERMRMLREAVRRDPLEAGGQRIEALAAIGEAAYRALGMRP